MRPFMDDDAVVFALERQDEKRFELRATHDGEAVTATFIREGERLRWNGVDVAALLRERASAPRCAWSSARASPLA